MSRQGREVRLAARPKGEPVTTDFALATVDVPDPEPGQVLVRNLFMSVDPYMRGRMNDVKSYVPPFQLGAPLDGGAVGSLVGQLVKARGGRVVGSAGSAEKVAWLTDELGFDAAFNYRDGPVAAQLRQAAPDGIDLYFDNVGGEHLEAAIGSLVVHGRAVICGMISAYNATEPPAAPRNLALVIGKRLRIQGVLVSDHGDLRPEFERAVTAMLADGRVKTAETVVEGLEHAADAFIGLLRGENTGKMVVKL